MSENARKIDMLKRMAFAAWKRARAEASHAEIAEETAASNRRAEQAARLEQADCEAMIRELGAEPVDHDAPPKDLIVGGRVLGDWKVM
jgi:hypothetical protein